MLILMIERKKLYIAAGILAGLCAVFLLKCGIAGRKMSVGAFLTVSEAGGQTSGQVEVFDIEKGLVIGSHDNNAGFRKEAQKYLNSISGMYGNLKVFPKVGYIVKIPLEPPVKAPEKLMEAAGVEYADTIYIIFPSQGKPYLLLLDEQDRPYCFNFEADTAILQRYIVGYIKTYTPQKPPEHSMEELYYDISMSTILPHIQKAVDDYYTANFGISPSVAPWQINIQYIERPHGYRTYLFQIKLEALPYTGPHRTVGTDRITLEVSSGEVKVMKFEHLKSYPVIQ
jgi:hypothetical protein